MRRWIKQLRQKPEPARRRIALGTSASITGLIALVWITVLVQGGGVTPTEIETEKQTASPVSALDDNAAAALSSLQNQITGGENTTSTQTKPASTTTKTENHTQTQAVQPVNSEPYWETNDKKTNAADDNASSNASVETNDTKNHSGNFWPAGTKEKKTEDESRSQENEYRPAADPRGSGEWF